MAEDFLSGPLASNLKQNLVTLFAGNQLKPAGTGNQQQVAHDTLFRSDMIYWLDRKHENTHENSFFDQMDSFVSYLNATCYTGISSYEFHYTLYEPGSFYKKHIDQFQNNDSRQFSMIMYLNADWMEGDGGELNIYHESGVQQISPINGRIIFFKSNELPHEVLMTNKPRMSITGWLKS